MVLTVKLLELQFMIFFMGVESNPSFGDFDFKLHFSTELSIGVCNLVDFTFVAKEFELYRKFTL